MNTELKKVLVADGDEALEKLRVEWQQTVELHDTYDKHEAYRRPSPKGNYWGKDNITFCRTCGQILMTKDVYNPNGDDSQKVQSLRTQLLKRYGSEWNLGILSEKDVALIPEEFRHFVYEQLFWKLGEADTTEEEAAAILSCRNKNVSHTQLRQYAVTHGGVLAYAYAKSYNDFADDLKRATWSNPDLSYKFLRDSKQKLGDDDRVAISRKPELAYLIAKEIDKGPHPVTRNGAAKRPDFALSYAVEIDKSDKTTTTRGTTLRSIAMRTNIAADKWMEHFGGKPCEADRKSRSRTKWGAFHYAKAIDKGPHPVTEAGVRGSFFYGCRYAYEIKGAPMVGAEESCQSAGWSALEYALTFNKHTSLLENGAHRNSRAGGLYNVFRTEKLAKVKMTRAEAMKKSYLALVYMAVNDCFNDDDLTKRANSNQTYKWIANSVRRNKRDIATARARIAAKAAAK